MPLPLNHGQQAASQQHVHSVMLASDPGQKVTNNLGSTCGPRPPKLDTRVSYPASQQEIDSRILSGWTSSFGGWGCPTGDIPDLCSDTRLYLPTTHRFCGGRISPPDHTATIPDCPDSLQGPVAVAAPSLMEAGRQLRSTWCHQRGRQGGRAAGGT